jgi:TPR repeat protein
MINLKKSFVHSVQFKAGHLAFIQLPVVVFCLLNFTAIMADPVEDTKKAEEAYYRDDLPVALELYRKAANEGYAPAQVRLAYILDWSESNEEAVEWYRKAAEQNNAEGKFGLGVMYSNGEGVETDPELALKLISESAEQEYPPAMNRLGVAYERGEFSLDKDENQALLLIKQAAELGDKLAMQRLIKAYRAGELGLAVDAEQAQYWTDQMNKKRPGNR